MPILAHFYLLILLVGVAFIWVLAALPARPESGKLQALWVLLLTATLAGVLYRDFFDGSFQAWRRPTQSKVLAEIIILLPFAASAVLWWVRRGDGSRVSARASVVIAIAVCLIAAFSLRQFNRGCVYYDYWSKKGEAWCPASWQAKL